jgi:hypothetical protein
MRPFRSGPEEDVAMGIVLFGRRLAATGLFVIAGSLTAAAQSAPNPNLPRSPYVLPEPTYREPDVDSLIDGNGLLHASGHWRHWGDTRNGGELFKQLFAPDGVLGGRRSYGPPRSRFCAGNPEAC